MKTPFLFLALSLLIFGCEKEPEGISFQEFLYGIWSAEEGQMVTRINFLNGTYVMQYESYSNGSEFADVHVFPESTYTVDKIGEYDFILFDNYSGGSETARIKVIWDDNEDPNVMAWDRGENTPPLLFHKQLD
jgi:hypothetical protein